MVEVRVSRLVTETLGDEGDVCGVTRLEAQILATGDSTDEVRCSRVVAEVLGQEPDVCGVTRLEAQILAQGDSPVEVRTSRIVVEVLAGPDKESSVTRLEAQILAAGDQPAEVRVSRVVGEALARQGSAGPVIPLALGDDVQVFLHNWATKATMTTSFRNSVASAPASGAESRRGLSVKPFRTLDLEWQLCPGVLELEQLERLEVFLRRMTDQRFQVPVYMDQVELDAAYLTSDTIILMDTNEGRFFPGARVVIVELDECYQLQNFSFHEILTMSNTQLEFTATLGRSVKAGSLVLPVMDCEILLEANVDYLTARVPSIKLTVAEAPGASQLRAIKSDTPTGADLAYDDRPIWSEEPDWSRKVKKGRDRAGKRSSAGRADFVQTDHDRSRQTHQFAISGNRSEMWSALEFFETRRGRLRSFWHIDQDQYMELVDIDAAGGFVGVSEANLDLADFQEEFTHLGLVMDEGSGNDKHYVQDISSILAVLTVFRITLISALPAGLLVPNHLRVARARLCRFESDEFKETWTHTGYMKSTIRVIEVLNEADYPVI